MNNNKISVPPMISTISIAAIVFVVMFGSYVIKHGSIVFGGLREHPFRENVLIILDYVRDVETSDKNKYCHYWLTSGIISAAK